MKNQIFKRILDIRNTLSNDFLLNNLSKNKILFNKLYASCDLLEDTESAIDYYKNSDFTGKSIGEKYILIYGLFEAFYIQNDATKKLTNVIINLLNNKQSISLEDFKEDFYILDKIKEYRNDIAGHPAYRDNGEYSVYLSQYSLSKDKVEYQKSHTREFTTIDIIQGINMQESSILNILNKVFEKLKLKEEEHYRKYKNEKLHEIFNKNYMYPREKIHTNHLYKESLEMLKELSNNIKQKLNERYINYKELNYSYLINNIDDIIDFLENKLEIFDIDSKYKNFIKDNMVEALTNKFDNLMEIFLEIDKKYEDYFNPTEEKTITMPSITIFDNTLEEVINVE